MSSPGVPPRPRRPERQESARASERCAHCEADRQDLYALPLPCRSRDGRADVCAFCYLKITHLRPEPEYRLE